jgi:hypothetical protein
MEGLSLAIKKIQEEGLVTGIKVTRLIRIIHLLFVDDILIMTKYFVIEWMEIQNILATFCSGTGLLINAQKTSFYQFGMQQQVLDSLKEIFLYSINNLTLGFKYLGYILKDDRFKEEDWNWILSKYENRISHWCNRWLTLGGRLVLVKVVLEIQSVYWLALTNIPSLVLHRIHQVVFNFLWDGKRKIKGFHLCHWHIIARPKKYGGWGLKNVFSFIRAMVVNTLWWALMVDGLWH